MLNEQVIQKLKPTGKAKKYADGGGLFLFVPTSGRKFWRMAYRYEKKAKLLTFGEYPHVPLRVARQRRDDAKKLLKSGVDPSIQQKAAKKAVSVAPATFRTVALEWYEQHTLNCKESHRIFLLNRISKYFFPFFGDKPMSDVTAKDIMTGIKALRQSGVLCGERTLADFCGQICRYAVATGKAERDATEDLPVSLCPRQTGHRSSLLDTTKFAQILFNLEQHSGYFPVKCALRLTPLLFARSGELRCAEWKEFDFSRKLWIIPAERMLTKHEHIVPLARQAVKILKELQTYSGHGTLLFPSVRFPEKPIDKSTITVSLRKRGYDGVKLSFEGIRSLVARLLAERGYERKVIAMQLGHQGRSEHRASFDHWQYMNERKNMMQEWADYLTQLRNNTL